MSAEQISKIKKLSEALKDTDKLGGDQLQKIAPNKEYFEELMARKTHKQEDTEKIRLEQQEQQRKLSPMEEARRSQRRIDHARGGDVRHLIAQAENAIEKVESVKRKLSTHDLKLKRSVQNVLRNKLTHIDESLKVALSKVGVDYQPAEAPKGLLSPVKKFLGYLTHGQHQLESLTAQVQDIDKDRDKLSPAKVLKVQLKMGLIQQELEFFASLLNKSLESVKTIMNVQV